MSATTRIQQTIPTSVHTLLVKEASKKGLRVGQLLTQILMDRYKQSLGQIEYADVDLTGLEFGE
jgi:hypothetical protein